MDPDHDGEKIGAKDVHYFLAPLDPSSLIARRLLGLFHRRQSGGVKRAVSAPRVARQQRASQWLLVGLQRSSGSHAEPMPPPSPPPPPLKLSFDGSLQPSPNTLMLQIHPSHFQLMLPLLRTAATRVQPRIRTTASLFYFSTATMGDNAAPSAHPPSRTDSPATTATQQSSRTGTPKPNSAQPKKQVRILMLHGMHCP